MMQQAGMPSATVAAPTLLLGVLVVQWWPALPSLWPGALLLPIALYTGWRWPRLRGVAVMLFGMAWAIGWGSAAMQARLPRAWEGRDVVVTGTLDGLPLARGDASTFLFRPERALLDGQPIKLHGRVRVAWYNDAPELVPCSRWHLLLRLKRPRGLANPGGTDSERTALEQGIVATGYVRADGANAAVGVPRWCIDRIRDAVVQAIAQRVADPHDAALLRAFTIGDTRGLDQHDWVVARANGIPHLIAISGFHVFWGVSNSYI